MRSSGAFFLAGAVLLAGIGVQAAETEFKPKIGGAVEAWYKSDNSELTSTNVQNSYSIRRARLTASGNVSEQLSYKFQGAFEAPTVRLFDAFGEYKYASWLQVGGGQFKYPFSLEGYESDLELPFILYAESVNHIAGRLGTVGGSFRDIGVQARTSLPKFWGMKAWLASINGSGINTSDNNNEKDLVGRLDINPARGLMMGASGFRGRAENEGATLAKHEGAYGAHAEYAPLFVSGLRLRSEVVAAHYEHGTSTGTPQKTYGYYVSAAYKIPSSAPVSEARAAWELAARWERFQANSKVPKSIIDTVTVGATCYLAGRSRLRFNYVIRSAESGVKGGTHVQETTANGGNIGNMFLAQFIVAY